MPKGVDEINKEEVSAREIFQQQLKAGFQALENEDFDTYMEAAVALGAAIQSHKYTPQDIKRILDAKRARNKEGTDVYRANRERLISEAIQGISLPDVQAISFKQKLCFDAFNAAWKNEEVVGIWRAQKEVEKKEKEKKQKEQQATVTEMASTLEKAKSESKEEEDERQSFLNQMDSGALLERGRSRHLRNKTGLSKEARMNAMCGLIAFEQYLSRMPIGYTNDEDAAVSTKELDKKAAAAIRGYQTKKQKALHYVGVFIGGLTSFIFGAIEGGVGLIVLLLATSCPPVLAYGLGIFIGAVSTAANWLTFRHYISQLLHRVVGKDKWFDGLTEYTDLETGEQVQLSRKKLYGLGAFALLAALPTGVAIGALGYGLTTSIPALFGLSVISAAFPPIAIAFAVVVTLGITLMLVESMRNLLHNKDVVKKLKEPFEKIGEILDKKFLEEETKNSKISPTRRAIIKGATYFMMALFAIAALAGLFVTCIGCKSQLSGLLTDALHMAPAAAATVGFIIGGCAAFISRMYFTFNSAVTSAVAFCKQRITGQKDETDKQQLRITAVDTLAAGIFFAYALYADGKPVEEFVPLALLAALRTGTLDYAHILKQDPSSEDAMRAESSTRRISKLTNTETCLRLAALKKLSAAQQSEAPEGKSEPQVKAENADSKKKLTFFISHSELSEARADLERNSTVSVPLHRAS